MTSTLMMFDNDVLSKAIDTYGKTPQTMMLFEEMAELQKEVCKAERGADNNKSIAEEMADVYIMLEQIKMIYGVCETDVQYLINEKTRRLERRLEKEEK